MAVSGVDAPRARLAPPRLMILARPSAISLWRLYLPLAKFGLHSHNAPRARPTNAAAAHRRYCLYPCLISAPPAAQAFKQKLNAFIFSADFSREPRHADILQHHAISDGRQVDAAAAWVEMDKFRLSPTSGEDARCLAGCLMRRASGLSTR